MSLPGLGIIAGSGDLPRVIAEHCRRRGREYRVVVFAGIGPEWAAGHAAIEARFERVGQLLRDLSAAGCGEVVFAGAMTRPKLDATSLDSASLALAGAMAQGDDATLRAIARLFESTGFRLVGAQEILPELLVPSGVLTMAQPNEGDRHDAARAAEIVAALGVLDVGQSAVVARGICFGVETMQGTDVLLEFVAQSRPDIFSAGSGVLYKAPKPGQDWRFDLPVIGRLTLANAAKAGLAGVVVQAGGVMALDLAAITAEADRAGLFLWGRDAAVPDRR